MERITTSESTNKLAQESTDRELQNELFMSTRRIEAYAYEQSKMLSFIKGILIFFLVITIIGILGVSRML
jgi:hypothetical protein